MARARKFVSYRSMERPYTRYSKYSAKSFVRARPVCRVVRFDMGSENKKFSHTLSLVAKSELQIRDLAIESARQTTNRLLEKNLPKTDYRFKILAYPHHILRENPLASGAGADRMSTGMAHSFGKPIGLAAQIKEGKEIMRLELNENNIELGRKALKRASFKIPCGWSILVKKAK
ncbi:MAG: 50S ribosomal protein L16 [Nanoarchaeota archaeon]